MSKSLKGLTILITRPEHQSIPLSQIIENEGAQCIIRPTLNISPPHDITIFKALPEYLNRADKIIFITANAVTCFFKHIEKLPENKTAYAMGPGTEHVLKKHTKNPILIPSPPYNTESFLSLDDFKNINDELILILSGEGGRGLLEKALRERGAKIIKADIYRRTCPDVNLTDDIPNWQSDLGLIIATSIESLKNLIKLTGKSHNAWLINMPLLVISERVENAAKEMGFKRIITSDNASDKGILQRMMTWYAQQSKTSKSEQEIPGEQKRN